MTVTPNILRQLREVWATPLDWPDTAMLWAAACMCFLVSSGQERWSSPLTPPLILLHAWRTGMSGWTMLLSRNTWRYE